MKYLYTLFTMIILGSAALAQGVNYSVYDPNAELSYYPSSPFYEESAILQPPGPGKITGINVYLHGETPGKDTIWVMQDPTDGTFPPSAYVRSTVAYGAFIINFQESGWVSLDLSDMNVRAGGLNRICIQHIIKPDGPYFLVDNGTKDTLDNWLNNVYVESTQLPGVYGASYQLVGGDYLVELTIEYDFPEGNSSAPAPAPSLVDVTEEVGIMVDGSPIKSPIASVADFNNDGWDDVAVGGKFFQNNGNGTFNDVTSSIGISANQTAWADIDNDGYIDCFAIGGTSGDKIYWGNESGSFTENTDQAIKLNRPTVTSILFDFDTDGDLDIFVANGRTSNGTAETYYQDALFRNDGERKFTDVTQSSGIANYEPAPYYDCWGASVADYNNDGYPDIYVNTYRLAPDLLYKNNGDGTFSEVGATTGARGAQTAAPNYFGHGMGSDWGDFDNDGDLDVAIGNLTHPDSRGAVSNKSLIFENTINTDNKFNDVTDEMYLRFFEMGAGILWVDLNQDGFLDLVHAQYSYNQKGAVLSGSILHPDKNARFYINQGPEENYRLKDVTWEYGAYIHGAWCPVRLDYDGDGDMDVLVASSNENVKLFRNDIADKGNAITVKLVGDPEEGIHSSAYGSQVKVYAGDDVYYRQLAGTVHNGRSSQSSNVLHFGLGDNTSVDQIEVTFANGEKAIVTDPPINQPVTVTSEDIVSVSNDVEHSFVLNAPVPNPASDNVNISVEMEKSCNIELSLFDLKGNKISEIYTGIANPGLSRYDLDISSISSGSYRITLEISGKTITEQLIIRK